MRTSEVHDNLTASLKAFAILAISLLACNVLAQGTDRIVVGDSAESRAMLSQAEALIAGNESDLAYDMLAPYEQQLAGSPYYDYLLGIAALDSGRASEAIFSLRRSILVQPRFSGARMELGRAYFETGNSELARPIFIRLLDEEPPPGVRTVLQQYIAAIDAPSAAPRSSLSGYVESFAGYDSNANGSTSDQQFLGFTLDPQNLATETPFVELAGGFSWVVPRSNNFSWFVNGRAGHRSNTDASFVNATVLNGLAGMTWQRNDWFGRVGMDGYWASRDGDANETYTGADLLLGRRVSDRWDVTLGLRAGAQRYDDAIEVLDVNRFLYTLGVTRRFESLALLGLELIGGNDEAQGAGSPYGNGKSGARARFSMPLGSASFLHAAIGSLTTDYDGLFFGVSREDDQLTASVQLEFRDVLTDGLSFTPLVRHVKNDSDIALYEYDRTEIGLIIRWIPR